MIIVPPGGIRALLVLRRKRNGAHLTLEFHQHIGWLMIGMEEFAFLPRIGAAGTEVIGLTTLLLQVAHQIVLMHPLHDNDNTRRCLVVAARKQG